MEQILSKSDSQIVLEMKSISKRFGPVQALEDVSLTLKKGSIHALVGENGAGKSTLMKILAGVHSPDSGQIEIDEQSTVIRGCADAIDAGVSMIYQELDLAEDLTVAQNIFLGQEPTKFSFLLDPIAINRQTQELIDTYQFDLKPDALISELSTGQCQLVEILKALQRNARVLVMDEPTSSLSEAETNRLFEIMRRLKGDGISIIYISHRLEEIVDLADEITVLRDGKFAHAGSMEQMTIPGIVHHMVGRELTDFYPSREVTLGPVCVQAQDITTEQVHGASFELREGEIVGLAGLVGAGRTQLAQALFGIDIPNKGSLHIGGEPVEIHSPARAIEAGIAYLTEDRKRTGLCLNLSCAWNITLPNLDRINMKHVIRPGSENGLADECAQKVNIKWAGPEAPADSLSGGNQQKVLIARWIMANSRFMIFDEPTRGIDVGAKKEIYTLLNSLAAQGKAILFISSELPELLGLCDRILVMRRGKLVADLETKQTNSDQIMHFAAVEEE